MRSLKQYINKICEKIAFKIVESENKESIDITQEKVEDFLGSARYSSAKFYQQMPAGVVIGLAYSSHGGSILYIESTKANHTDATGVGSLRVTG